MGRGRDQGNPAVGDAGCGGFIRVPGPGGPGREDSGRVARMGGRAARRDAWGDHALGRGVEVAADVAV